MAYMLRLIACILINTLVVTTFGQSNNFQQELFYGFKGGANYSTIKLIDPEYGAVRLKTTGERLAYHVGGFIGYNLNKDYQLISEVLYSVRGADIFLTIGPYERENPFKQRIDYLEIPLLARRAINNKLFVEVGPSIAFLLSSKDLNKDKNHDDYFGSRDRKPSFRKNDFLLNGGVGYYIKDQLSLNLRYQYGLWNINTEEFAYRHGDWYNRTLQAGFSYNFSK